MGYNMTAFGNATNILDMTLAVNDASSGLIGILAVVSIFIILLMNLLRNTPPPEAVFASSFVACIFSLIFVTIGLLGMTWFIGSVVVLALSGGALYLVNRTS